MSYHEPTHQAQMAAAQVNEQLLMAMGADGDDRAYHQRAALEAFGKLSARMLTLSTATKAVAEAA